jgi:hypothetical protein
MPAIDPVEVLRKRVAYIEREIKFYEEVHVERIQKLQAELAALTAAIEALENKKAPAD